MATRPRLLSGDVTKRVGGTEQERTVPTHCHIHEVLNQVHEHGTVLRDMYMAVPVSKTSRYGNLKCHTTRRIFSIFLRRVSRGVYIAKHEHQDGNSFRLRFNAQGWGDRCSILS